MWITIHKNGEAIDDYSFNYTNEEMSQAQQWANFVSWLLYKNYNTPGHSIIIN